MGTATGPTGTAVSILLCDDHLLLLDALSEALRGRGYDVVGTVDDPDQLGPVLRECRPRVCLLDVTFAGALRLDLVETVRQEAPETAIILLTARRECEIRSALTAGVVAGVLAKTGDISALDQMIQDVVSDGRAAETPPGLERPAARRLDLARPLTEREQEVLRLLAKGESTRAIADELGLSLNTVGTHIQNLMRKLDAHHRSKAVHRAREVGLIDGG